MARSRSRPPRPKTRPVDRLGHPTGHVFSLELVALICEHLRAGLFRANACTIVGVNDRTLKAWLARGRADLELMADGGEYTDHARALMMVEAAEGEVEAGMIGVVTDIAQNGKTDADRLKAVTWYLERKEATRYNRNSLRVSVGVSGDQVSDADVVDVVLDRIAAIVDAPPSE